MSQDTKLKMQSSISESAAATSSTKMRASDVFLVTKGLVSAAAAEALSKRSALGVYTHCVRQSTSDVHFSAL